MKRVLPDLIGLGSPFEFSKGRWSLPFYTPDDNANSSIFLVSARLMIGPDASMKGRTPFDDLKGDKVSLMIDLRYIIAGIEFHP